MISLLISLMHEGEHVTVINLKKEQMKRPDSGLFSGPNYRLRLLLTV